MTTHEYKQLLYGIPRGQEFTLPEAVLPRNVLDHRTATLPAQNHALFNAAKARMYGSRGK